MAALAASMAAAQGRADAQIVTEPAPEAGKPHDASLDDYRQHLLDLTTLVQTCAKARNDKACDPTLVGADDRVALAVGPNAERRLVRYGWLRVLLAKARKPDQSAPKLAAKPAPPVTFKPGAPHAQNALPPPRTVTELLQDAASRLDEDLTQSNATAEALPAHAPEREAMRQVLAGPDFRNLEDPAAKDTFLEKLRSWLDHFFSSAAQLTAHAAWVGRALVWGFILAACVALVWILMRLELRGRIRVVPDDMGPGAGAASARDWQLWLEDARKAADARLFREAVHFLYWASISRLESRRLWPADRARTPREYLALVAAEDPRKAGLATLTGNFERIWYGGRAAAEPDYRSAEQLASALISASGSPARGGSAQ
ncbi:MAG: DUF4129 domain-containing protein [Terracidiphilus sp.]|jgi:hypothetical protein